MAAEKPTIAQVPSYRSEGSLPVNLGGARIGASDRAWREYAWRAPSPFCNPVDVIEKGRVNENFVRPG